MHEGSRAANVLAPYVNRIPSRRSIYFSTLCNISGAVSSLPLGAGVSAASYAATATCFFAKDCHERTLVEDMTPLISPRAVLGLGSVGPGCFNQSLSSYTSFIVFPRGVEPVRMRPSVASQVCRQLRKAIKRQYINTCIPEGYIVACDCCRIDVGRTGRAGSATCQPFREDTVSFSPNRSVVCSLGPKLWIQWLGRVAEARSVDLWRFQLHRLER